MQKKDLRKRYITLREQLSSQMRQHLSQLMVAELIPFLEAEPFEKVFFFAPHRGEPDLWPILQEGPQKIYCLPRMGAERTMEFRSIRLGDPLEVHNLGIKEPPIGPLNPLHAASDDTVILVPALAMDRKGRRLGYGGGYFDRYLARFPEAFRIGVTYGFSLLENLPFASHDIPMHKILTESGLINKEV